MSREIFLETIDLTHARHGLSKPIGLGTNAFGRPIVINGVTYQRGLGMHAGGSASIDLGFRGVRFQAVVGKDDDQIGVVASRPVQFLVFGDNRLLWHSGVMEAGQVPQEIDVGLRGLAVLRLVLESAGCDTRGAIANWADARIEMDGDWTPFTFADKGGAQEFSEGAITTVTEPRAAAILTPEPDRRPRINGARVLGVRPGSPVMYGLAVSGTLPITHAAQRLPAGLYFDRETGRFSGALGTRGSYRIPVTASNEHGTDRAEVRLEVGDTLSLTPPMGWESWNCWGASVDDAKVREAARMLVESGLDRHGWNYVIIDDGWQGQRDPATRALTGNEKFPDMQGLCDYIHGLGLKVGIYSTPWATSFMHLPGGSADTPEGKVLRERRDFGVYSFHREDAAQFARWGVDLLKYDGGVDVPHALAMRRALDVQPRDVVYSLSGAIPYSDVLDHRTIANYWRVNGDINDTWQSIYKRAFCHYRWQSYQCPGHWNDPDMMVVGVVGWGKQQHASRLTPDEQYTHVSLWVLFGAPLLLGCDLSQLDDFTMNLLTNDEIIAINQDPLGVQARRIAGPAGGKHVYAKPMADGSLAVGLFNTGAHEAQVRCNWEQLGISGERVVRDAWRQKDLGTESEGISFEIAPHGAVVVVVG